MLLIVMILAAIGVGVSLYTYITEKKVKADANYKPFCDLSDQVSCSKVMKSEYSNLFFISNAAMGIFVYIAFVALAFFDATKLIFFLALASSIASCVLAYILYFKIRSFCVLCTTTYIINFLILAYIVKVLYFS